MVLLIDGYNVLRVGEVSREQSDREIRCFLRRVATYASAKKHEAIVVFDGGLSPHPKRCFEDGVTIIYAGHYQRADDKIMRLLHTYQPGSLLVISSDHEIENCAHGAGVVTMDALAFRQLLWDKGTLLKGKASGLKAAPGQAQKRTGHKSSPEIDALMEQASSKMMVKWDDMEPALKEKHENKKSKRERELERVIKKL